VPESTETGPPVITAVAPAVLPREQFSVDTRGMLAVADAFHVHHPCQRVVFAGAVTRWLHGKGFEWTDLGVDFFQALRELDEHALALAIDVIPLAMAVVGSAASHCTIHWADGATSRLIVTSNLWVRRCCRSSSAKFSPVRATADLSGCLGLDANCRRRCRMCVVRISTDARGALDSEDGVVVIRLLRLESPSHRSSNALGCVRRLLA
jgi:hypothetical protein